MEGLEGDPVSDAPLLAQLLGAFHAEQVNVDDLPAGDPTARLGKECADLFTNAVATLRAVVPNERIQKLATVLWDLVGNKYVLIALGPKVPGLVFSVMRVKGVMQGIVFIPENWPEMSRTDTFMQLGAVLFTGAQIVDYYNDRLLEPAAKARWGAYEAELLLLLRQLLPTWKPNEYQLEAMKRFPAGLNTKDVEVYTSKPYERRVPS